MSKYHLAYLACSLLVGCGGEVEPGDFSAALLGDRLVREVDGERQRWFDRERGPRIRVDGDCGACVVRLRDADTHTLSCQRRDDPIVLTCALPDVRGAAELQLVDEEGRGVVWPIVVERPPAEASPLNPWRTALWRGLSDARAAIPTGPAAAYAAWALAARQAAALGSPSEAARRFHSAAYFATLNHDFVAASGALADARRHLVGPGARGDQAYNEALLAKFTGDLRSAGDRFRVAADAAIEAADPRRLHMTREALAVGVLLEVGREREAMDLLAAQEPWVRARGSDLDWARWALNTGFVQLRLALERDRRLLPAARARMAGDAEQIEAHAAGVHLADHLVNQAWAAHAAGDRAAARATLDRARGVEAEHESMFQPEALDLLDGEIALAEGALADAALAFGRRASTSPSEASWRAHFGLGRVALAREDREAARAALATANAQLEQVARNVAVRTDRGRFLAQRDDLLRATLELLLAAGEDAEAFAVADAGQARVLRTLTADARVPRLSDEARQGWHARVGEWRAAQAEWQAALAHSGPATDAERAAREARLSALQAAADAAFDETTRWLDAHSPALTPTGATVEAARAALGPADVLMSFVRMPRDWLVFRLDRRGLTHARVLPGKDPMLPFLPVRGHLYVVTGGRRDLYDLGKFGKPVSFLPHAGFLSRAPEQGARRLVAVDPDNNLPYARSDAQHVGVDDALVGEAATRDAILAGLPQAKLFHFSGHGVLHEDDPWAAHLRTAGGRLTVGDVLMSRVPGAVVVLSGCSTGAPEVLARDDVVGLPEAFLAAGARAVLATGREVPDPEASRFAKHFYANGGDRDPGAGLLAASQALRSEQMKSWNAWRLVGRP